MIIGKDFDRLSSYDELRDAIDRGLDIVFGLSGIRYNISWEDKDKVFISVCPAGDTSYYKDMDDLLNNHYINGTPLKALWREIEIYSM